MLQLKQCFLLFVVLCITGVGEVPASNLPEGFESLFEFQLTEIKLRNLDGSFTAPIKLLSTYDTVKIDLDNKKSQQQLESYFENNAIRSSYREKMLASLINGATFTGEACLGKLEECQLYPDEYEFLYNFNDQELYLFVSSDALSLDTLDKDRQYHVATSEANGLINSIDFYATKYNDQEGILSVNNETTLGLPFGYLRSDFHLSTMEDNSELYEAAYHFDVDAYSGSVGYFKYLPDINSTDFLNTTAALPQYSAQLASSKKLLMGGRQSDQLLTFYAPQSGYLEVRRSDGRMIYQRPVKEGQGVIRYSELPSGRYEVTLEVLVAGEAIVSQIYQIYNSGRDSLPLGSVDYVVSAGMFSDLNRNNDASRSVNQLIEDTGFARGLMSYRLFNPLLLGLGGLVSEEGGMLSGGVAFSGIDNSLSSELVYSKFNDAQHFKGNLYIAGVGLSYEKLKNELGDPLASYMYNHADYSRLSLNATRGFGMGQSLYAIYAWSDEVLYDDSSFGIRQENEILTLGYSSSFILGSYLNFNVDYNFTSDNSLFNLLWTVPLSDTIEVITAATTNKKELQELSTAIRKDDLFDSDAVQGAMEVRNIYDRDQKQMYQEATFTANTDNDVIKASLYGTASTDKRYGTTLSVSNTQVFTGSELRFTSKAATSYALINVEQGRGGDAPDNARGKGYLTLSQNGKKGAKMLIYEDSKLIPLTDYISYQAKFDAEPVDLYNSGESHLEVFTHPGTVTTLTPKVSRVVSFITAFNDIQDQPVKEISCVGEGCLTTSEVTEGVFRITVLEGLSFQLSSNNNNTCMLPYEFSSTKQLNFGSNYCLPMTQESILVLIDGQETKTQFLGVYENSNKVKKVITELELAGYSVIRKNIGNLKAVFIAQNPTKFDRILAKYQKTVDAFKLLAKQNYYADSISFPVVQIN